MAKKRKPLSHINAKLSARKSATTNINYFRLNEKNRFRSIKSPSLSLIYACSSNIQRNKNNSSSRPRTIKKKEKQWKSFLLLPMNHGVEVSFVAQKTQIHIGKEGKEIMASSAYCCINNNRLNRNINKCGETGARQ